MNAGRTFSDLQTSGSERFANAGRLLAQRLEIAGLHARIVSLPPGHDPNSYFVGGATAADFLTCLQQAQPL